jgi:aspartate kinase
VYVPVVTGFLARGRETRAVTTLGRGGSDLTATVIGAALNHPEVLVWKDVDGVLTTDPRLVSSAIPVPELTYHEVKPTT